MEGMEKLFVYGTLKKGFGNHSYLKGARFLGRARTKHRYALYEDGVPFLVKTPPIAQVKGEVYEVSEEILERIDKLEGHPTVYRREKIEVVMEENGKVVKAWVYLFPYARGKLIRDGEFK